MNSNKSLWYNTDALQSHEKLIGDIKCDVLIIGGGFSGILTSYFLNKKGINSVIVEASKLASGQTGRTTAKITSQHGAKLSNLSKKFSLNSAIAYLNANENAIEAYAGLIKDNKIKCGFERLPSYLYTLTSPSTIIKEYEIAKKSAVSASICGKTTLPFDTKLSLRFDNQAQFNPIPFISALSQDLKIYENTRIIKVEDNIAYSENAKIKAKKIVFATHYPIINFPGYYFMRMHQSRSYVVVLKNAEPLYAMYYSADKGGLSFRNYNDLLLISGCSHRTGESVGSVDPYKYLFDKAKRYYPNCELLYTYSAQDCMPVDELPFAGLYSPSRPDWYVLSGYAKWGMTNSMVSAQLVSDMIAGDKNPLTKLFDPHRSPIPSSTKPLANELAHSAKGLMKTAFKIPLDVINDIPYGGAKIIEYKAKRCAVYKSEQGEIYSVSPVCPHLGCQLSWNPVELSWDCPCHGSRFSYTGELLDNPSKRSLNKK